MEFVHEELGSLYRLHIYSPARFVEGAAFVKPMLDEDITPRGSEGLVKMDV